MKNNKPRLEKTLVSLDEIIRKIQRIKIDLIKNANDPEKVRTLAKDLEAIL